MTKDDQRGAAEQWNGNTTSDCQKRRRVAFLVPNMNVGGVQRVRLLLARWFLRAGWSVDFVLVKAKGELLKAIPDECDVVGLGNRRMLLSLARLRRYLSHRRPDLVIASIWPLTSLAALAALFSRFKGVLLMSEHSTLSLSPIGRGLDGVFLRMAMRWLNPRVGPLVAVSEGVRRDLIALGANRERVYTIHNPVEISISRDSATSVPEPWRGRAKRLRWLAVGRLKDAKDYPMMLAAFAEVLRRGTDAGLVIAGDGVDRAKIEQIIASNPAFKDRVALLGDVPDPSSLYTQAGLFLFSSKFEGFGNVLVEALAAGLPIVATDCRSGPREILLDGALGQLVPVGDALAFADAIERTLDSPHVPEPFWARARDFRLGVVASRYIELFEMEAMRKSIAGRQP